MHVYYAVLCFRLCGHQIAPVSGKPPRRIWMNGPHKSMNNKTYNHETKYIVYVSAPENEDYMLLLAPGLKYGVL